MIRSLADALAFTVYGLLLPAVGASFIQHSATPLVCWLLACSLIVATARKNRHV